MKSEDNGLLTFVTQILRGVLTAQFSELMMALDKIGLISPLLREVFSFELMDGHIALRSFDKKPVRKYGCDSNKSTSML